MRPVAALLPGGRLHLQHGPIDLILAAEGPCDARARAFAAAQARFDTVLDELVSELPLLRAPLQANSPRPTGTVAHRMDLACRPFADRFVTRMAAVAGAVADTVLAAMRAAAPLDRAYVNNGGDIALHLAPGQRFVTAMQGHDGGDLGRIEIAAGQGVGGIATSGRHGRSHSLGIADSVTVLAETAAAADAAATLIANAVDLPEHPAVQRQPARDIDPDSDLGNRPVVTSVGALTDSDAAQALGAGDTAARSMMTRGLIRGAALTLGARTCVLGHQIHLPERSLAHA